MWNQGGFIPGIQEEPGRESRRPSLGSLDEPDVESREEPGRESRRPSLGSLDEPDVESREETGRESRRPCKAVSV